MKQWKKMLGVLLVCCMIVALSPGSLWAADGRLPFTDVSQDAWYRGAVTYVYERDLMVGVENTKFCPESSLTRDMFVTILGRMANVNDEEYTETSFDDVEVGQWYSPYVEWASQNWIVKGYDDGCFRPQKPVTREEMAVIVSRYVDYTGVEIPDDENAVVSFVDKNKISDWAEAEVDFMRQTGLLSGNTAGYFYPLATATRAEAATFFMRLHQTFDLLDGYVPGKENVIYDHTEHVYYTNNILLIFFDANATGAQKERVISAVDGVVVSMVPSLDFYQVKLPQTFALDGLASLGEKLMNQFSWVAYATYDSGVPLVEESIADPDDPWNGDVNFNDWNDDSVDGSNWWLEAVDAYDAWNQYGDYFDYVDVGICDSSFDTEHEELRNQYLFPSVLQENRNQRVLTSEHMNEEPHYHGTHVAGIIGAEADNGVGITGIAGWNAVLMFAPIYSDDEASEYLCWDSSIYANYAALVCSGAKVVNFSLGKTNYLSEENPAFSDRFIAREGNIAAICTARLLNRNYDFVVVQAAGNAGVDAIQNGWFACITDRSITASKSITTEMVMERVLVVGAADRDGDLYRSASFSNYGNQVDLYAPGCDIYSSVPGNVLDDTYGGEYEACYGTSMAAPIVTGVCALVWAVNDELSGAEVRDIVCENTGFEVLPPSSQGWEGSSSLVNAYHAVAAAYESRFDDIAGIYQGYYYAQQGKSGVTLTVSHDGSALFEFYNLPGYSNVEEGSFSMSVDAYGLDFYYFTAADWIEKPSTYSMVDLYGHFEGNTIYGEVIVDGENPNEYRFEVTRVSN